MVDQFSRTELLIGKEGLEKLASSRVAVFGIGGVGGYTAEALVDVARERILDINPNVKVNTYKLFFTPETEFDFSPYDYVVDAIDTVSGKIAIIERSNAAGVPVISSMGAGNKMNPQMFEVADIYKTSVCPLAKVMRQELKKRGVKSLKVVYSKENPIKPAQSTEIAAGKKRIPGSNAFTPSVAGLIIAAEVIKDICGYQSSK